MGEVFGDWGKQLVDCGLADYGLTNSAIRQSVIH